MLTKDEIKDFFILESSHAKRELGQNFLISKDVVLDIVNSLEINKDEKVLEIGPGLGSLTEELLLRTNNLTVVEYDHKFVNFLTKNFENSSINIVKSNILHFKDYLFSKIIGNLPYYITSDIIEYILLNYKDLKEGVFMVQKECLDRIMAKSGKDFNVLNILLDYRTDIKKLFIVKRNNFFPEPNIDSIVFKINVKENSSYEDSLLIYKVSTILFKNRRKTIYNNLKVLNIDDETLKNLINSLNLKLTTRAEELNLKIIEKLVNELLKIGAITY